MALREGKVVLDVDLPNGDVSRSMDVFYNPVMESNRNISVALLSALMDGGEFGGVCFENSKKWKIGLPLSGSGIRGLRFLKELDTDLIERLWMNDKREGFITDMNTLLVSNSVPSEIKHSCLKIFENEADLFLLNSRHFDYIDIDPFGSPNPFLASSIARLTRGGVLAVTATDTAALCGTYKGACRRKYFGEPMKNYMMHNIGLRLLIRKVQLIGAQYDKALIPVLSYWKDHYYRVFFVHVNSKTACDEVLRKHSYFLFHKKSSEWRVSRPNSWILDDGTVLDFEKKEVQVAGKLWTGALCDVHLLEKMLALNMFASERNFLIRLHEMAAYEEKVRSPAVGFYDLHEVCKTYGIAQVPKFDSFLKAVEGVRCYFSRLGFYSMKSIDEILEIIKR